MNRRSLRGSVLLLLAAMIWGCAFVAQSVGMDYIGPITFNGVRSFIGAAALVPVIAVGTAKRRKAGLPEPTRAQRKKQLTAGVVTGVALFAASTLQQMGLTTTAAGKAGFITAMYIVVVPVLGILFGRRAGLNVWISVAIAVAGLYLLCMTGKLTIERGDAITLVSVVFWALQILSIDHFAADVDCVRMNSMAFLVDGLLSLALMFVFEEPSLEALSHCVIPLLYTGVMSSGIAFTFQAVGQKYVNPTVASILMSLESVFAALAGFLLLHNRFSTRELLGGCLMFVAVILAQLDFGAKKNGEDAAMTEPAEGNKQ